MNHENHQDSFNGPERRRISYEEKRATPSGDRRKNAVSERVLIESFASQAFGHFLGAAIQHVGPGAIFDEGKKVNFDTLSRLSWMCAKSMMRHGRDFVKEYDEG